MGNSFPPSKDADLLAMALAASTKITASPTTWGLTALMATTLSGLVTSYQTAYNEAVDPVTRTKPKTAAKNAAKRALAENLRDLNRFVQATKTVTDEQKLEIQFPVYAQRTPINPPTTAPVIKSITTVGRNSKVVIRGLEGDGRGRPAGVQGAVIMSFVGAVPPIDLRQWTNEGLTTRTDTTIVWPPSVPAHSACWVTAAWYSPRGQAGPNCDPVSVSIGGGVSMSASEMMKEAA